MAKKNKKDGKKNFYSHVEINKAKRWFVRFSVLFLFVLVTAVIFLNTTAQKDWTYIVVPIVGMGVICILLPQEEKWIYEPWQSRSRIYERER